VLTFGLIKSYDVRTCDEDPLGLYEERIYVFNFSTLFSSPTCIVNVHVFICLPSGAEQTNGTTEMVGADSRSLVISCTTCLVPSSLTGGMGHLKRVFGLIVHIDAHFAVTLADTVYSFIQPLFF
jgi:hypothetical protein